MDDREEEREESTIGVAKILRGPSAEDLASQLPPLEPNRTWCPSCVADQGDSNQHRFKAEDAVVGLDCGYLAPSGEADQACTPILCGEDSFHKCVFALTVPKQGVENRWCGRACAFMLSRAGFARVELRSDTEPALIAPRTAIGCHLPGQFGTDVLPQGISVVDSAGNGLAEQSVREVKAKARSLAHAVFVLLNVTLDPKDSSGRLDGTMGGDANQHREKGPEWADSLVMAICSCIGAPDRRIWRDSSLHPNEDT